MKENEETGVLKRDYSKSKSSPFVAKGDLTLVDCQSTQRQDYRGVQIPKESKGKREQVFNFISLIILISFKFYFS